MPKRKLTGVVITKLKPAKGENRTRYFDSEYAGLCLRVGKRDKSWCYLYRFDGHLRSDNFGRYAPTRIDHMDRAAAVAETVRFDQLIEKGIDPRNEKQARVAKAKPTTANPNAFHRRVEEFLIWYETSPTKKGGRLRSRATIDQARRLITDKGKYHYVEPLSRTDVSSITRADILRMLGGMSDSPFQANRIHAYLDIFFTWSWDRGYCDPSPMVGLKKQYAEKSRERTLTNDEIRKLWAGCLEIGYLWGDLCRFTLATGQRPGECRRLNRDDLKNWIWLVEGGVPKNRERHRIPLPTIARQIVKAAPVHDGSFVFSTTIGKKSVGQGGKPYALLKEKAGFTDWQLRDLRRTFITLASEELDIDNQLIGAIANQKTVAKPGVAGVYNKASWIKQKKETLGV